MIKYSREEYEKSKLIRKSYKPWSPNEPKLFNNNVGNQVKLQQVLVTSPIPLPDSLTDNEVNWFCPVCNDWAETMFKHKGHKDKIQIVINYLFYDKI